MVRSHGASATDNEHRYPVTPSVEDRHACVLEADHVVYGRRQWLPGGTGVSMGNGDGDFFMATLNDLWHTRCLEVYEGIVEAPEARSRIQGNIGNTKLGEHLYDEI
jgi:hypothetical protein